MLLKGLKLQEYFQAEIKKACFNQKLPITEILEFYLVNLLSSFHRTEQLFKKEGDRFEEEPLALILAKALEGNTATQVKELKRLGDTSLYITGFFSGHIGQKAVSTGYYIDMGSSAYDSLAGILSAQRNFSELYEELSQKFASLAGILGEVSVADHIKTNLEILHLYERWLKTGEEKIRELLAKEGIVSKK